MKRDAPVRVVFHPDFYPNYTWDPAAHRGRMECIIQELGNRYEFLEAIPASPEDIAAVHSPRVIERVEQMGLYGIASLAAGGAVLAAEHAASGPVFAAVRPPGHHASPDSFWGFCFFNNLAVALDRLKRNGSVESAFVLDFDLHYGDGTVNCFRNADYVSILNPEAFSREAYLEEVAIVLERVQADVIALSAGFDHHREDWGGLLATEDYREMGRLARRAANRLGARLFGVLEGGYNHRVLGRNVLALLEGMGG